MAIKIRSIQGIWRQSNKKQKVFLVCLAVLLLFATNGFALIGGALWFLLSLLNSNAGFIIAQSAIPAIVNRFNKKNLADVEGPVKFSVPKRTDTSDATREIVLNHAMEYLQRLTGLGFVKDQIKKYKALMMIARKRRVLNKEQNQSEATSLNLVFMGSPGTGKRPLPVSGAMFFTVWDY